jgi:hypothetical protein
MRLSVAGSRRRLAGKLAVVGVAAAGALLITAVPAAAQLAATVTPDSDLAPGDTVTVSWTGGTPAPNGYAIYSICVRGTLSPGDGALYCNPDFSFALNDANGAGSGPLQVAPGTYGSAGESCTTTCYVAVSEPGGASVVLPIDFASAGGETTTTTVPETTTTTVPDGTTTTAPPAPTTAVTTPGAGPASTAPSPSAELPRTGMGSTAALTTVAVAAIALGALVTRLGRRAVRRNGGNSAP